MMKALSTIFACFVHFYLDEMVAFKEADNADIWCKIFRQKKDVGFKLYIIDEREACITCQLVEKCRSRILIILRRGHFGFWYVLSHI